MVMNATKLTLVKRQRSELFGTVTRHGKTQFLRVDRFVSNTDWPLDGAADIPDGVAAVATIHGDRA